MSDALGDEVSRFWAEAGKKAAVKATESKSIVQPVDLGGANLLVETVGDNLTNVNDWLFSSFKEYYQE